LHCQAIVEFGRPLQRLDAPTPDPTGAEVLIRVCNAGVCHSDVHIHDGYFDLGNGQKFTREDLHLPHTLGHEIEGEVIAVGSDVTSVRPGDRRAVFPWIGCGRCGACRRDEEQLCGEPRQLGCSPGVAGGYASHVQIPHERYLLDYGSAPPALSASYMCAGLTGFGAVRKIGGLGHDDTIVIVGFGGVGMMALSFIQALYGRSAIVADVSDDRLAAARAAGATQTVRTDDPRAAEALVASSGAGAAVVIDFVGSEASFQFSSTVIRRGAKIILVGLFGGAMTVPLPLFPLRPFTVMGSFVGSLSEANEMMALVRSGQVAPIPVTCRPLSEASAVLDALRHGRVTGRIVLNP
jgi:D-arabinose 1-dehydrogenase-like Zn-dependent alcohol dehydrogenase